MAWKTTHTFWLTISSLDPAFCVDDILDPVEVGCRLQPQVPRYCLARSIVLNLNITIAERDSSKRGMAQQSPMISIPKKSTDEVDWSTPIRNLIAQSYGDNPDNYASECASLQRCRQDAVRGAGSDMTGEN